MMLDTKNKTTKTTKHKKPCSECSQVHSKNKQHHNQSEAQTYIVFNRYLLLIKRGNLLYEYSLLKFVHSVKHGNKFMVFSTVLITDYSPINFSINCGDKNTPSVISRVKNHILSWR